MKICFTILLSLALGSSMAQGKFFGGNGDGFAVSQSAIILPVDLLTFGVSLQNNIAQLSWTAHAENIASFTLEVSSNGQQFEWLAAKTVVENAIAPVRYGYADGPRTGLWYYRLKWTEADGSVVYSKIISVKFLPVVKLQAYYDVGAAMVTIRKPANDGLVELYSADGKLQKTIVCYQPVCQLTVHGLAAGVYIVSIGSRKGAKTQRVMITLLAP
mgnify:CR=1 FL=1